MMSSAIKDKEVTQASTSVLKRNGFPTVKVINCTKFNSMWKHSYAVFRFPSPTAQRPCKEAPVVGFTYQRLVQELPRACIEYWHTWCCVCRRAAACLQWIVKGLRKKKRRETDDMGGNVISEGKSSHRHHNNAFQMNWKYVLSYIELHHSILEACQPRQAWIKSPLRDVEQTTLCALLNWTAIKTTCSDASFKHMH